MAYRRTPHIQQRLDDQQRAIVQAAVRRLRAGGYAACSVSAVAGAAGVATGTVYRHFAGKHELIAEAFRQVVTGEVAAVAAGARTAAVVEERLAAVVETFAGRALKSPRLAYALLVEPVDPQIESLRLRFRSEFAAVIAAIIDDGVRTGVLPPQPANIVAAALVGAIAESLVGPLAEQREPAPPELLDTLITVVVRAAGGHVAAHP